MNKNTQTLSLITDLEEKVWKVAEGEKKSEQPKSSRTFGHHQKRVLGPDVMSEI